MPVSSESTITGVGWLHGDIEALENSLLEIINKSKPNDRAPVSKQIVDELLTRFSISTMEVVGEQKKINKSIVASILNKETGETIKDTEMRVRELLRDYHGTFSLFEVSVSEVCKPENIKTPHSINLYIQDISNPQFVNVLKKAMESGLNPNLLTLEIYPDNYGIVNHIVTNNLREVVNLGFRFSMILDEDAIREPLDTNAETNKNKGFKRNSKTKEDEKTNLGKILDEGLTPEYLKLSKSILDKINSDSIRISKILKTLINQYQENGSIQYITPNEDRKIAIKEVKRPNLPFLEESTIEEEDILDLRGKRYAQEHLIRFGEGISVTQGLERLKILDMTDVLMGKMLKSAVAKVKEGHKISINCYLKNLGSPSFQKEVLEATKSIPRDKRGGLIFEILEERYGFITPLLISNIKWLQQQGFAIAIDDLFLGNNTKGMSKEILETLHEEKITPDYIKIDGKHIEAIRKRELSERMIIHLKEIIGHFSVDEKKSLFILEWIQDTDHAILAHNTLCCRDNKGRSISRFLYQGRNVHVGEFGTFLPEGKSK